MEVYNLGSDEQTTFSDHGNPLYSVCCCWAEENNRMSQWSFLIHSGADLEDFKNAGFPVTQGKRSIACGAWGALI